MTILCIHNDTGSRFYRLIRQLQYMQELGHKVIMKSPKEESLSEYIKICDLVIFQMVFSDGLMRLAKKLGKKIIFECDDLLHAVPKTHYSYEETKGFKRLKWLWRIRKTLKQCDGFICATENLAKRYGKWCKNTLHFPNYCDLIHWLKESRKNQTDRIRILWAGSTSHTGDLLMIKPVIERILDEYKDKVQFIYMGHGGTKSENLYTQYIYGEDLFDGMQDNRESILAVPSEVFPYVLSTIGADIAIAPLENKYFNKFKSQCKYLEYAINGIPGVYSAHHYTDVIHRFSGFKAKSKEEFYYYLKELIEHKDLREAMGESAKEHVISMFGMEQNLDRWRDFIYDISGIKR